MKALLIDDHPLILAGLEAVVRELGEDVDVTCVATARSAREALAAGRDFDIALLDLQLGEDNGFELLVELRAAYPSMPVVIVAASERRIDVLRAIDLGAMGFVSKCTANETLLDALRMVMAGGIYLPPSIMRSSTGGEPLSTDDSSGSGNPGIDNGQTEAVVARLGLTPRQTEVLGLLLRGQSNKLIARALNVSVETVKDHVAAVLRALKVSSRTQAVLAVSQMANPGGLLSWRTPSQSTSRADETNTRAAFSPLASRSR